jgi:hypothetical protein
VIGHVRPSGMIANVHPQHDGLCSAVRVHDEGWVPIAKALPTVPRVSTNIEGLLVRSPTRRAARRARIRRAAPFVPWVLTTRPQRGHIRAARPTGTRAAAAWTDPGRAHARGFPRSDRSRL